MPARRVYRKKKLYKRKRQYKNKGLAFKKAPLPNRFAAKLRYSESATINPGSTGTTGVHVISANGLYDPNITGTGHQPRGFDQFMNMYDHYVVVGAKITVTFSTGGSQANFVKIVGINVKDSASTETDPNEYMEGRNVTSKVLNSTSSGSIGTQRTLVKSSSTKKFLGRSHPLSDSQLKGSASANPIEQLYFHIWAADQANLTDAQAINAMIVIDYLVVFIEPKQPAQS